MSDQERLYSQGHSTTDESGAHAAQGDSSARHPAGENPASRPLKFPADNLPTPRLELAWKHVRRYEYTCEYVLVIRLRDHDIRIPEDDQECREHRIPMSRGITATRGVAPDTFEQIDMPFRDGAHARWDSRQLSGLPIFATYNGIASRIDPLGQQGNTP